MTGSEREDGGQRESPSRASRWVVLDLLDRQIIEDDQQPVGKVDDVEFGTSGGEQRLTALLSGAEALGQRLGGLLGRGMAATARRMAPAGRSEARAVPWNDVRELGYTIVLRAGIAELGLEPDLEVWLRSNVIGPIPGSGRARS